MPRHHHVNRRRDGFTILELVIVMGITAVLIGMSGPKFNEYRKKARTDEVARGIYSAFLEAKSEALRRQNDVVITFDTQNQTYSVIYDEDSDWEPGDSPSGGDFYIREDVELPGDYCFARDISSIYGVDNEGTGLGVTFKNNMVVFQPSGRISDAHEDTLSTLVKRNNRSVYIIRIGDAGAYDYGHIRGIVTDGLSGQVQVWRWNGSAWVTRD